MPGRGPAPKDAASKVTRHKPTRGEPAPAVTSAWVGDVPVAPDGLMQASLDAWATWFGAWFAAFWTTADVPALRQMIRLFDQVERGEFVRATELRMMMDTYGVTPKGQQDRRWKAPEVDVAGKGKPHGAGGAYGKLRAV